MSTELAASRDKQWLDWRRTGIGASDAPIVAGRSPYKSRAELWLEKVGKTPRSDAMTPPQMWGHLLEAPIAAALQRRIDCQYSGEQVCFASDAHPWQLATLDRVTTKNEVVELKSVNPSKARTLGDDGDVDSLPEEWLLQSQHQLAVTGFELVIFGVFVGTTEDIRIYHVERNQELIDALTDLEAEFWESVQAKEPPPALDHRDAEALTKHFGVVDECVSLGVDAESLVEEYERIKDAIASLESEKDQARAKIMGALGGVSTGVLPSGRIVKCSVTEIPEGTFARKAYRKLNLSIRNPKR